MADRLIQHGTSMFAIAAGETVDGATDNPKQNTGKYTKGHLLITNATAAQTVTITTVDGKSLQVTLSAGNTLLPVLINEVTAATATNLYIVVTSGE